MVKKATSQKNLWKYPTRTRSTSDLQAQERSLPGKGTNESSQKRNRETHILQLLLLNCRQKINIANRKTNCCALKFSSVYSSRGTTIPAPACMSSLQGSRALCVELWAFHEGLFSQIQINFTFCQKYLFLQFVANTAQLLMPVLWTLI